MDKFSEDNLRKDCPHCDPDSYALEHILKETNNFWITCDVHPLIEGHILIIPRQHLSAIGEFPEIIYSEFLQLNREITDFLLDNYKKVSSFEHGNIAQTVFHSHVHYLPFNGAVAEIIKEGEKYIRKINSIDELKTVFTHEKKYLFFSIGNNMWVADSKISIPGFFRDRFANAVRFPQKSNWKEMHKDKNIMESALKDIKYLETKWKKYYVT